MTTRLNKSEQARRELEAMVSGCKAREEEFHLAFTRAKEQTEARYGCTFRACNARRPPFLENGVLGAVFGRLATRRPSGAWEPPTPHPPGAKVVCVGWSDMLYGGCREQYFAEVKTQMEDMRATFERDLSHSNAGGNSSVCSS